MRAAALLFLAATIIVPLRVAAGDCTADKPGQAITTVPGDALSFKLIRVDGSVTVSVGDLVLADVVCDRGCDINSDIDLRRGIRLGENTLVVDGSAPLKGDFVLIYELLAGTGKPQTVVHTHVERSRAHSTCFQEKYVIHARP